MIAGTIPQTCATCGLTVAHKVLATPVETRAWGVELAPVQSSRPVPHLAPCGLWCWAGTPRPADLRAHDAHTATCGRCSRSPLLTRRPPSRNQRKAPLQ